MRNLQKILALVLALVMSLSLMATAGAEFTDQADIDETFAESVDVLNGLEVFQGYPTGDFQPKGEITRAEVAVIIYRIATGDVDDTQVGIYADYNKFSDVYASEPISGWAAGYINYCANAEYIKGRGDGKFDPTGKVTGYEALAMILRVVGYDKNGEFTGADWQVQTAAIANQQKVTKNVNAGLLGQAATREMVAELLCQAILIPTVNYTLAYGYQQSTNPQDTIAYQTFKMEKLEGVVTGNEIADLKNESPMAAGQTRLVIDGREETMNFTTGLESIGKSVRAYIRPQNGTTNKQLVPGKVYDTEKNHVYDSFAKVSTVGNSTGSAEGITSIEGAEHFINYDQATRWTANIRITYVMDVKWTEYQAKTMRRDNGGALYPYDSSAAPTYNSTTEITKTQIDGEKVENWATQLTSNSTYTYHYTKTILLDEILTAEDYDNLYSIFTNGNRTGSTTVNNWIMGEVHVGTTQVNEDISDEIRWTDFVNTYLRNEDNRALVESNGLGNRLIIIDNNDDGIAEYVLQTIYTIAKVSSDAKYLDILNTKLYDGSNSDAVNSTSTSDTLVSVSGKELAASEETLATGDVVIYALIDGNIRAQKAETKSEKINTVNRAGKTITTVGGDTYNESAVHTHSNGLKSGVTNMVGNTTYTMYFDLDGNMAAFTEGANGGLVLITNGWHNSTITGAEYAVQAYLDGALQTVNVSTNGSLFVSREGSGNTWDKLRHDFGILNSTSATNAGPINSGSTSNNVQTIVANLDGDILTPVDKTYLYSQNLRMLDMVGNEIPNINNYQDSWGIPYETVYGNTTGANVQPGYNQPAYNYKGDTGAWPSVKADGSYEVRGLSNTVYYVVYKGIGTDTMTNGQNVVVRTYTGYNNIPSSVINSSAIEDVYAVGARATGATSSVNGKTYYAAQVVVIEMGSSYNMSASEQVFIPDFSQVGTNETIEEITMIRGNGEKEVVKVDMSNSDTGYYYDPANGVRHGARTPGLYFMDPSDTNAEIFVIRRMTAADIRDNNYLVGYISESTDTIEYNYPQVELMVRPDKYDDTANVLGAYITNFGSNSDLITAQNTYPHGSKNGGDVQLGKAVGENSKLYTYGGTTGTLTEAPKTEVFAQYRQDNSGTTISGLNERWDEVSPATALNAFPRANRNEVLIRYSGNTIVYAVSFNETDNKVAQQVWWNLLPQDKAADNTASSAPAGAELTADNAAARARIHTLVQTLNPGANNILLNNWTGYTGKNAYIEITPAAGNTCWVNGQKFTETTAIPLDEAVGTDPTTVTVISQLGSKDPVTTTYTIHYITSAQVDTALGTLTSKNLGRLQVTGAGTTVAPYVLDLNTAAMPLTYESIEKALATTTGADVEIIAINDSAVNQIVKGSVAADGAVCKLKVTKNGNTAEWTATVDIDDYAVAATHTVTYGDNISAYVNGAPVESPFTVTGSETSVTFVADGEGQFMQDDVTPLNPSTYNSTTGKTTYTWPSAIGANVKVTFVPVANVDAQITSVRSLSANTSVAQDANGNYTVTVPWGTDMSNITWSDWVNVASNSLDTKTALTADTTKLASDGIVTLTLEGSGTGDDATVTLTFVANKKVDAGADSRYSYSLAGITSNVVSDENGHIEANITVDESDLRKFLADNTDESAGTFEPVLQAMLNGSPDTLWWGLSVIMPENTDHVVRYWENDFTNPSPLNSTQLGSHTTPDGYYQDWMNLAVWDTGTKTWTVNRAASSATTIVYYDSSNRELGRTSWDFTVTVNP